MYTSIDSVRHSTSLNRIHGYHNVGYDMCVGMKQNIGKESRNILNGYSNY